MPDPAMSEPVLKLSTPLEGKALGRRTDGSAVWLAALPQGAVLGTSSLRRKAMALRLRPDLRVVEFRGNVETRLQKMAKGVAVATMLAVAGL